MGSKYGSMEIMELSNLFSGIYQNKTVLITGDTGFKGSWLAYWLLKMGANVIGFSLDKVSEPDHFSLLKSNYLSVRGDINKISELDQVFLAHKPEIVFHLAAQSLVRKSYENPLETIQTNILGTANLLDRCLHSESVKVVINVTSDKCYENREWIYGYREIDPMGGYDPYSASKACSELVTASYRRSFFEKAGKLLASVRAGNVIGGGDWSTDRLIPDLVRSTSKGQAVTIRNPVATRPWQHVLDPLSGYLMLGWYLLENKSEYVGAWNFGPSMDSNVSVIDLIEEASKSWNSIDVLLDESSSLLHEANLLMLDCSKANKVLKWHPVWNFENSIQRTISWYKYFYSENSLNTENDLLDFVKSAKAASLPWAT